MYQEIHQEMKWLWTKDLCVNTVHISDTTRALWEAAEWLARGKSGWDGKAFGPVPLFNVVDKGATCQGTLADIIGEVFKIETGFQGTLISTFARLNMESVVDDLNEETLEPWADLLADANITRPGPLSPFMEKELLKDTDLSMDGSRFESVVGFKYDKPKLTADEVEKMLASYRRMNWWP